MRAENQLGNHGGGYMCDFEFLSSEDEENGGGGHAEVKRPLSEFESEIMREEIMQHRQSKAKSLGNKYR